MNYSSHAFAQKIVMVFGVVVIYILYEIINWCYVINTFAIDVVRDW